jgi:hypothetical protein
VIAYTVHEARIPPRELERRAEDVVFVKEGFSWWALAAPLPWLLYQRLWLEALTLAIAMLAAFAVFWGSSEAGEMAGNVVLLALNVILGFSANDLRRWALERRGQNLVAVVVGASEDDCERRFFSAWLPYAREDQARRWHNPTAAGPIVTAAPPLNDGPRLVRGTAVIGFPGEGG